MTHNIQAKTKVDNTYIHNLRMSMWAAGLKSPWERWELEYTYHKIAVVHTAHVASKDSEQKTGPKSAVPSGKWLLTIRKQLASRLYLTVELWIIKNASNSLSRKKPTKKEISSWLFWICHWTTQRMKNLTWRKLDNGVLAQKM